MPSSVVRMQPVFSRPGPASRSRSSMRTITGHGINCDGTAALMRCSFNGDRDGSSEKDIAMVSQNHVWSNGTNRHWDQVALDIGTLSPDVFN